MASAVRWPNSASKTAARARRRPVRSARTRSEPPSAADAIDCHGHRLETEAEEPLDGGSDGALHAARDVDEVLAGAGDDPEPDPNAVVGNSAHDRSAGERRP